jgi:hypothetical protein
MKTALTVLVCCVSVSLLSSCHLKSSYAKNQAASAAYLADKKSAPAKVNVEGVYFSPEWGIVLLKQTPGGKVSGQFGEYGAVVGVVSGKKIFLTTLDSGWTEYTFELSKPRYDRLQGQYSAHIPFSESDQKDIVLEKIRY